MDTSYARGESSPEAIRGNGMMFTPKFAQAGQTSSPSSYSSHMPASGDSSPFPTSPVDSPRFSPLTFMEGSSSSPSVSPTAALADAPITPHRVLLFPKPLALPRLPLASPSPAPSPPPLPSFPSSSSLQRPSPYPLRSSPSLPSFAAYTPLPPPGEKRRASQKSMIKTFTARSDEYDQPVQLSSTPTGFLDMNDIESSTNQIDPDKAASILRLIEDVQRLTSKEIELTSQIRALAQKRGNKRADQLRQELERRKQILNKLKETYEAQKEELQKDKMKMERLQEQVHNLKMSLRIRAAAKPPTSLFLRLFKCLAIVFILMVLAEIVLHLPMTFLDSLYFFIEECIPLNSEMPT